MNELTLEYRQDFRDYLSAVSRHKVSLLATAITVFAIGAIVALVWPSSYRSTATILIEEQEIPQDLVRSTVSSYADQRIQVISQQVMTRANLMQIVDKYTLYPSERKRETTEEILERMRKDIRLDLVNSDVTDRRSGGKTSATIAFTLSYDSQSAEKAQKVANELTSLYLNENLQIRKQKADETSSFLAKEAEELGKRISEIEEDLSGFKRKNQGSTPELAQINMSMRDRTDNELLDTDRAMASIEERRFYLEAQLAQIKPNTPIISGTGERILDPADRLKTLRAQYAGMEGIYSREHPDMKRMRRQMQALERETGSPQDGSEESKQLTRLKTDLAALRNRYADDHPDMIKLRSAIAALEKPVAAAGSQEARQLARLKSALANLGDRYGSDHAEVVKLRGVIAALEKPVAAASDQKAASDRRTRKPENPAYLTLQAQLEGLNTEARALKQRREELHSRLTMIESRLEKTPEVEREYLDLSRDRENTVVRYRQVKAKLMEAEVAQELEQARKSERFSLIDPAQFPEKPRSPNRPAILLIGVLLALGGGVGSVGLLEVLDSSVRNSKDLSRTLAIPLLSVIPYIVNEADRRRAEFPVKWLPLAAIVGIVAAPAAIHFLWIPPDVFWFSLLRGVPICARGRTQPSG